MKKEYIVLFYFLIIVYIFYHNNALVMGNQMNQNMNANEDCGCDGGSTNVDIMSHNLGMAPNQQNTNPVNTLNSNTTCQ